MARLTAVTLAAAILALGGMAGAEHEVSYRDVVLGVVTDGQGTRLDLDGDRVVERPAWFGPTPARWLGSSP